MKKKKLLQLESVIREVICRKDPLGLCSRGTEDELDREVRSIAKQIDRIHSASDAAQVIANVFASSFGRETVATLDFPSFGQDLFNALTEAGCCPP